VNKVNVKELRRDVKTCIKDCKSGLKGLSEYDHERIDLEGKIYAYEFVLDVLLEKECNPDIFA
jgi:hypothetical protein